LILTLLLLCATTCAADFTPDPASIQHEGPAYRYPQAGWIVVHVEGAPYERGVQQGKLLHAEIQDYIKCFAAQHAPKSPADGWKLTRTLTDALFTRHFDPELLEEMKGIADGANAAGAKFDSRPLDLTDIVALNAWPEIISLDDALRAVPTGLEGKDFDKLSPHLKPATRTSRCSAFAATGSATKDGKAIIGHITMFDIYPCNFFNVWLDVKPAKGHRVVIQAAPGSVQSGMDWYINDAGIVLTETTIAQTRFNPTGQSIGSRSRMAMQYGDDIDSVVKLLGDQGNGLYTNEWLLADMKTNEIAMFELGTHTSRLLRSSKDQWFDNTKGFYWGCNNTKDLAVRMETLASTSDRPADMTFCPEPRDTAWVQLYLQNKGNIDSDFGKLAFGKPPLAARNSCDAKYTTADMALQMKSFAHWGDPYGQLWEPRPHERQQFPAAQPIVPNDWTVLTANVPPAESAAKSALAVDLDAGTSSEDSSDDDDNTPPPPPVWHGTLLPATDADLWLATAFARFHDYVAHEHNLIKGHDKDNPTKDNDPAVTMGRLTPSECDDLAVQYFAASSAAIQAGAAFNSTPLRQLSVDPSTDAAFQSATGRGFMILAELRRRLGPDKFDAAMDAFGRDHAAKPTTTDAFVQAMAAAAPEDDRAALKEFFAASLDSPLSLPTLELKSAHCNKHDSNYAVTGSVSSHNGCTPASIDITLETDSSQTTRTFPFNSAGIAQFKFDSDAKPTRITVNKYAQLPCTNTARWSNAAYKRDLEHTLIIYGTKTESEANKIAAGKLQQGIIDQWQHTVVPIKPDTAVSEEDLHAHHLILVGRPSSSELIARLSKALPVTITSQTFTANNTLYANPHSAVIASAPNPSDPNYSIVCVAGLSPAATLKAAESLPESAIAPIRILTAGHKPRDVIPTAVQLSRELP
ncbi:MAG TPA: C45 family autoproteolytic acyltransferase/hydrolase, partial [Tepidisphaeraceae bacterium]